MAAIHQLHQLHQLLQLVYSIHLWHWTSMFWLTDTCQNKASADQYHVTISRAQVYSSSSSAVFLKLTAARYLFSIGSQAQPEPKHLNQNALTRLDGHAAWTKALYSRHLLCLGGKRFGKYLSPVLIQNMFESCKHHRRSSTTKDNSAFLQI